METHGKVPDWHQQRVVGKRLKSPFGTVTKGEEVTFPEVRALWKWMIVSLLSSCKQNRCCVLILLMIIRVTQLSAAPLLTSLLLCNWSVTLRDTSATEFTPTDLSSLYSLLNGCAQWHYATQDPSWLLSKPFQIQFILLFLIWLMCKRYSTSIPLSLCSVVIHGAVLSFCGGVNGSGFSAPAEPIGTAEWNYSWASSSLQTNPWAAMSALLTSHAFCCVLLQHISLLNI